MTSNRAFIAGDGVDFAPHDVSLMGIQKYFVGGVYYDVSGYDPISANGRDVCEALVEDPGNHSEIYDGFARIVGDWVCALQMGSNRHALSIDLFPSK